MSRGLQPSMGEDVLPSPLARLALKLVVNTTIFRVPASSHMFVYADECYCFLEYTYSKAKHLGAFSELRFAAIAFVLPTSSTNEIDQRTRSRGTNKIVERIAVGGYDASDVRSLRINSPQ